MYSDKGPRGRLCLFLCSLSPLRRVPGEGLSGSCLNQASPRGRLVCSFCVVCLLVNCKGLKGRLFCFYVVCLLVSQDQFLRTHQIHSHEIYLPQDQLSRDQFATKSTQILSQVEKNNIKHIYWYLANLKSSLWNLNNHKGCIVPFSWRTPASLPYFLFDSWSGVFSACDINSLINRCSSLHPSLWNSHLQNTLP